MLDQIKAMLGIDEETENLIKSRIKEGISRAEDFEVQARIAFATIQDIAVKITEMHTMFFSMVPMQPIDVSTLPQNEGEEVMVNTPETPFKLDGDNSASDIH